MTDIDVACAASESGWGCAVTLRDDQDTRAYHVTVAPVDAEALAAAHDQAGIERLVEESFDFLLEREPKESILSSFDLSVISQYFPEYEHEIQSRLAP